MSKTGGRWAAASVVVVLAAGLVACGGSGSEDRGARAGSGRTTTTTVAAGYKEFREAEKGFALAIPQDWQIPRNAEVLQQQADAVREQNPRLAEALTSAKTLITQGHMFAVHPEGAGSVNLIVSPARRARLEDVGEPAVNELRSRGVTVHSQERTTLAGVPAVKLTMSLTDTRGVRFDSVQYHAIKGERIFILTLTGHDPALGVIAQSLRLT
jgi:hypothetical protein